MMRKLPSLLAFSVCSALLLIACGGGGSNTANTAGNTAASNTSAANTAVVLPAGDKTGIAECDEYIAKYESCINSKVPEAMRASFKGTLEAARKGWRDTAATAEGKARLPQICKTALEQAKQAFGSYGCNF